MFNPFPHFPPALPQSSSIQRLFNRLQSTSVAVSVLFCIFGSCILAMGVLRGFMQSDLDLAGTEGPAKMQ